jgi:hypothetical protein
MIFLEIGSMRRPLGEVTESWIAEQVGARRAEGQPVCLRVQIQENGYDLSLATTGCPSSGRGRAAHPREEWILDLWNRLHLGQPGFTGGNVIAFLKQLQARI